VNALKKWSFLKKNRFSQKKMFWGIIGSGLILLILFLGLFPLIEDVRKINDEITMKRKILQKYDEFLLNRKTLEDDLQRTLKQHEEIQKRLLPGETPQLGGATLQEIVKRLADKNGIGIRSFKILDPKETAPYQKVSIQIDFNPVNNMLSLGQFIFDLENHEKKLMISEMDLLILNIRIPNNIQGNFVVTGLMKGTRTKEKGREG
jgi:hypothetical protein